MTTQEVRAETITYSDVAGEYTHAVLYYSLDGLVHGNRAPMRVEGLPARYQRLPALPEREAGNKEYRPWAKRTQFLAPSAAAASLSRSGLGPSGYTGALQHLC